MKNILKKACHCVSAYPKSIKHSVISYLKLKCIQQVYAEHIKRLKARPKNYIIKVGFLVNEEAKWQYQSLYEEMEESQDFKPIVLISDIDNGKTRLSHYRNFQSHCEFFKKLGLRAKKIYHPDTRTHKSLSGFDIDILFYQQPWSIPEIHSPLEASRYALTCYVPYSYQTVFFKSHYLDYFHKLIWKNFLQDDNAIQEARKINNGDISNCVALGYPKFDTYTSLKQKSALTKKVIIYAPHHSFAETSLRLATFQYNGKDILQLAKYYKDSIHWVFKPHPAFKHAVIKNEVMTETEVAKYYEEWAKLGEIYESAHYEQLFVDSSGMITDCGSFVGEYLASKNPLFHLWSDYASYNDTIRNISTSFYRIHNFSDLKSEFKKVVIDCNDYKYDERITKTSFLYNNYQKCSTRILNYLRQILNAE